jgi:hypothetical protein
MVHKNDDVVVEETVVKKSKDELQRDRILAVREKEDAVLREWKRRSDGQIVQEGVFYEMDKYVRMVSSGIKRGVMIVGKGGLSKTYTTLAILNELGVEYGYVDSYTTPAGLYAWIFEHRDMVLVFDDVVGLLSDKRALAYLKSATDTNYDRPRVVHNLTTKPVKDVFGVDVPNHFVFTGSVIILSNELNKKNVHIMALLTRFELIELDLSYEQKLAIMREIVKLPFKNLSASDRLHCLDTIISKGRGVAELINFRTLIKLYQTLEFARGLDDLSIFERLSAKVLKNEDDEVLQIVRELEKKELSRPDKIHEFMLLTGKSKATYYRVLEEAIPDWKIKELEKKEVHDEKV